jgi:hypothetical protein
MDWVSLMLLQSFQRKRRGGEMLLEKTGQARADFFKHVFMKR